MEFGVCATVGVSTSVDEDDTWSKLSNVFIEEYGLHETPIGTSCVDVLVAGPANPALLIIYLPTLLIHSMLPSPFTTLPSL